LDVGLCLRILPPGEYIEFIIEKEKLEKIRKVVKHNEGRIVARQDMSGAVMLKVEKL